MTILGGVGLAMMMWETAQNRTRHISSAGEFPKPRELVHIWPAGPSAEYYRIIDRATDNAHIRPPLMVKL
jgi:hypothetical protein